MRDEGCVRAAENLSKSQPENLANLSIPNKRNVHNCPHLDHFIQAPVSSRELPRGCYLWLSSESLVKLSIERPRQKVPGNRPR